MVGLDFRPPFGSSDTVTDPLGGITHNYYDALDRLVLRVGADERATSYSYTALGQIAAVEDPGGAAGQAHGVTSYDYDASGNLVGLTDAAGNLTQYEYDGVNRLVAEIDALGRRKEYFYSTEAAASAGGCGGCSGASGSNVMAVSDAKGQFTGFSYNTAGALIKVFYDNGAALEIGYDAYGRQTSVKDGVLKIDMGDDTVRWNRDGYGRVYEEISPKGYTTQYGYDSHGRRNMIIDPAYNRTDYEFDSLGRLSKITNEWDQETDYSYDSQGRLRQQDNANGTWTLYDYDGYGRLARLTNYASDATTMSEFGYHYDSASGNVKKIDLKSGARNLYAYDVLDRLTEEAMVSGAGVTQWSRRYAYDAVGNRTRLDKYDGSTTEVTTYQYNALNQLTQYVVLPSGGVSSTWVCSYDANGNLSSKSNGSHTTNYTWNVRDRLVKVEIDQTTSVQYVYDFRNDRIERRVKVAQASGLWTGVPNDPDRMYFFDGLSVLLEMTKSTETNPIQPVQFDNLTGWTQERGAWEIATPPGATGNWAKANANESSGDFHRWLLSNAAGTGNENPTIETTARVENNLSQSQHAWAIFSQGSKHVGVAGYGYDPNMSKPDGSHGSWFWQIAYSDGDEEWYEVRPDAEGVLSANSEQFKVAVEGNRVQVYPSDAPPSQGHVAGESGNPGATLDLPAAVRRGSVGLATFGKATWFDQASVPTRETWQVGVAYTHDQSGGGRIIGFRTLGGESDTWYHYDRLGNVEGASQSSGEPNFTSSGEDSFGVLINGTRAAIHGKIGKGPDVDSSLYYFNARWYSTEEGRFLSRAPGRGDGERPYAFCENNPISLTDPSGNTIVDKARMFQDLCTILMNAMLDKVGLPDFPGADTGIPKLDDLIDAAIGKVKGKTECWIKKKISDNFVDICVGFFLGLTGRGFDVAECWEAYRGCYYRHPGTEDECEPIQKICNDLGKSR